MILPCLRFACHNMFSHRPIAGRWQSAPSLLSPRSALAACALNGLYAVGGLDLNGATPRTEQLSCIAC